jgi:3-hydroxyacyl-CoA dehydrogenase
MDFDAGLCFEAQCFKELLATPESKALQYAFFSDRRAAVLDGLPANAVAQKVSTVGIVGAGTMGTGIALCTLNAGLPTVLVETRPEALEQALARIRGTYEAAVAKGRVKPSERDRRMSCLKISNEYNELRDADLIIEAVFEDLEVKQEVFRTLDRVAKPEAILASNTSTLDVDRIAAATQCADRVVGLHFFSPANVMRLLEVVRGKETSPSTLLTAMAFAKKIGKTAVVARVCDGFIGNRMFEEYLRQAYFLLDEGATPSQVDHALEQWGMAMGPFAVMDLAGGDIGWAIRKRRAAEQADRPYSKIPDRICELGRFGQKTAAGYYKYDAQRRRVPDPEIEELIAAYSREIGIHRRSFSNEEIVTRLIFALVNEGAKLLAERIAQRGSDVDVVYRNGYGFPAHRGGPFFHADIVGLARVLDEMESFRRGYQGQLWAPAPLLVECAERGSRLSSV